MPKEKIHNSGYSAEDVGLRAKQLDGIKHQGRDMDASWRNKDPLSNPHAVSSDAFGAAQAREQEQDQVAVEARRRIERILEEEARRAPQRRPQQRRPQQQRQVQTRAGLSLSDLAEGLEGQIDLATTEVAQELFTENYSNPAPEEAALYTSSYASEPTPRASSHDWTVQKYSAKLKGGKTIPVWKVHNSKTQMSMEKPFRIREAAERISTILNQTGDVNDHRIAGIMEAYDRHRQLMKQRRQLREAIQAGRKSLKPRLVEVQDELEQVNYKLGI